MKLKQYIPTNLILPSRRAGMINISKYISCTILTLLILCELAIGFYQPMKTFAQASGNSWTPPTNLSHSGSSTNPVMVIDELGNMHVIWQDLYSKLVYTHFDNTQWSNPIPVLFPFSPYIPQLLSDGHGAIHAFWFDERGNLFYSQVLSKNFKDASYAWTCPIMLGQATIALDAVFDSTGNIHLVYVGNANTANEGGIIFPDGIYYRQYNNTQKLWLQPVQLYQSTYLRDLKKGMATIDISTAKSGEKTSLYVVWDNQPRKQLFLSRSIDSGKSWDPPMIVDDPNTSSDASKLFNIRVASEGEDALILWEAGASEKNCALFYKTSQDGGNSWSNSKNVNEQPNWCPQGIEFVSQRINPAIIRADLSDGVFFLAWDGNRWSDPQKQDVLSGFEDPETKTQVKYACIQTMEYKKDQIFAIGCDQGSGEDIWFTGSKLGNIDDWFPQPSAWSTPLDITEGQEVITSPVILTDLDGMIYAFWS